MAMKVTVPKKETAKPEPEGLESQSDEALVSLARRMGKVTDTVSPGTGEAPLPQSKSPKRPTTIQYRTAGMEITWLSPEVVSSDTANGTEQARRE